MFIVRENYALSVLCTDYFIIVISVLMWLQTALNLNLLLYIFKLLDQLYGGTELNKGPVPKLKDTLRFLLSCQIAKGMYVLRITLTRRIIIVLEFLVLVKVISISFAATA